MLCFRVCLITNSSLIIIIAFDELRTDFKSPIDQCNPAHAVSTTSGVLSNSY
uniref:Uncharacterized protein n=1 Tax=Pavo cristatus TaxID=9049 RepID=A0A8C9FVJ0_PAVCR